MELCGGTHVGRSGDIGLLLIESDTGISSGVRRIECLSGAAALEKILELKEEHTRIADLLRGDDANLADKVSKLALRNKSLEKEISDLKSKLASHSSGDFMEKVRTSSGGIQVIAEEVEGLDDESLRAMVDRLRLKLGSGVVAIGTTRGEKAMLVAGVTSDLKGRVHAGKIVKEAISESGGKGGGRPDFAQAGGIEASQLKVSLDKIIELLV